MDFFNNILHHLFGNDLQSAGLLIFNIIIIESLLSVDNAAVLATMVTDLPPKQRPKALKYGIIGAYVFRGLSLIFAAYLIKWTILKFLGGGYLLWLMVNYFRTKATPDDSDDTLNKKENWFYKNTIGMLGPFWSTIVMVEVMDLAFSLDNVFAVVAFTDNIYIICVGVFIGILAMRFVAQGFVKLLERYPFLESVAFIVIGILGLKLMISSALHTALNYNYITKENAVYEFLEGHETDLYVSIFTSAFFLLPILTSYLFNFPKRHKEDMIEEPQPSPEKQPTPDTDRA
jgi:YkoY family integral membrane protein